MVRVLAVAPETLGADLGLVPGTQLVSINGRPLEDFLDWEFLSADEQFVLRATDPAGETTEYDVQRPEGLSMGVELEPPHIRRCANRCDFCFVDGLPPGLRRNLYIRDDDYRLSFRYGNFATLTNLKPKDIERIFEYHLSPLYVSVHATDAVIRRRYLRNPRAPDVLEQLQSFGANGIRVHTQIVLQPDVNDGDVLTQSLEDLNDLGDIVLSVSVVPVGLTAFSKVALVREPNRDECRAAINVLDAFTARARRERGRPWVFGSDELYVVADLPLPPADSYGGFEQVENGVGSVRYLERRIAEYGAALPQLAGTRIGVFTGTAMGRLLPLALDTLRDATGATYEVVPLENDLFGPSVTTAALLPGRTFRRALATRPDLDLALLPAEAVNDAGFLIDDVAGDTVGAGLGYDVRFSYDFGDALLEWAAP